MPKAVIIGATSGIGRALASVLAENDYELGLAGRRESILKEMKTALPVRVQIQAMDLRRPKEAAAHLQNLIKKLNGMDLLVLCAGVSFRDTNWESDLETIQVNILGFTALARVGFHYFRQQGSGHLVGISSVSGIRGRQGAMVYSATKAYVSNYLQGLRQRVHRLKLGKTFLITDIIPGFVDTPLIQGKPGHFWIASVEKTARQIYLAIRRGRRQAYVTRRWQLIAWFLKIIPLSWHERL